MRTFLDLNVKRSGTSCEIRFQSRPRSCTCARVCFWNAYACVRARPCFCARFSCVRSRRRRDGVSYRPADWFRKNGLTPSRVTYRGRVQFHLSHRRRPPQSLVTVKLMFSAPSTATRPTPIHQPRRHDLLRPVASRRPVSGLLRRRGDRRSILFLFLFFCDFLKSFSFSTTFIPPPSGRASFFLTDDHRVSHGHVFDRIVFRFSNWISTDRRRRGRDVHIINKSFSWATKNPKNYSSTVQITYRGVGPVVLNGN